MKGGTNLNKDVLYIDADDEITAIIDKMRTSQHKIVALVLPKRAAVLQSIVNMKLLKRAMEDAKKNVVLITAEVGLLPLAGSVGLHVAKSLQSKPEVPDAPLGSSPGKADASPEEGEEPEVMLDQAKTVGELSEDQDLDEAIELEDEAETKPEGKGKYRGLDAKKLAKKFKIPNFGKFRLRLLLGGIGVILLVVGLFVCAAVLPKASITIKTETTSVSTAMTVNLQRGDQAKLDVKSGTVPAGVQEVKKTLKQEVKATGEQNNGAKATGTIVLYNCNEDDVLEGNNRTILAGTGVNANGLTFILDDNVVVPPSHFKPDGTCKKDVASSSVGITAQQGGAKYNQDADIYVVAGYATITGQGSKTAGGTDDILKIVTQGDIDSASQKIGAQDTSAVEQELQASLSKAGFYPVSVTFSAGTPETKSSANAGVQAESVTVTQTINYSMLGAKEADLEKLIANDVEEKIDPKKQVVLDYGLSKASFSQYDNKPEGFVVNMQVKVVAGPDLDEAAIKQQIAGQKAGAAERLIKAYPGVSDVSVKYSPFWVSSIPKKPGKITVVIIKTQAPAETDESATPTNP